MAGGAESYRALSSLAMKAVPRQPEGMTKVCICTHALYISVLCACAVLNTHLLLPCSSTQACSVWAQNAITCNSAHVCTHTLTQSAMTATLCSQTFKECSDTPHETAMYEVLYGACLNINTTLNAANAQRLVNQ